jgi:hypothetical protein
MQVIRSWEEYVFHAMLFTSESVAIPVNFPVDPPAKEFVLK